MIRQLIITCLIVLCTTNSRAQDMAAVFTAMPDQYIPQLEHAWRKDLVDLYKEGKEARLKNTMNGFSALRKLTADYLLLETTERSTVEMKLLPLVNKTYIVCMIATVKGPAPDSPFGYGFGGIYLKSGHTDAYNDVHHPIVSKRGGTDENPTASKRPDRLYVEGL